MRFFVYLTINQKKEELWLQTGDQQYITTRYIGSKSIFEKNYFGSSKSLLHDVELYGTSAFKSIVLCELIENDKNVLLDLEQEIQISYNVVESLRFYNKRYANLRFSSQGLLWYHNSITGEREKFKNTDKIPNGWIAGSGYSSTSGKIAYHDCNTRQIVYLDPDDIDIPKNLIKGIPAGKTSGLTWYYDPGQPTNRKLVATCPVGWEKGMGDFKNHAKRGKTFKYYYHPSNPTTWIQINVGDQVPPELIEGRIGNGRKGSKWWYNPDNPSERRSIPRYELPPDKWVQGNLNTWSTGLIWYHDPNNSNEVRIKSTDMPPVGWIKGRRINNIKQ